MISNDNFFYFTKDKNTVILIPLNPAMRQNDVIHDVITTPCPQKSSYSKLDLDIFDIKSIFQRLEHGFATDFWILIEKALKKL